MNWVILSGTGMLQRLDDHTAELVRHDRNYMTVDDLRRKLEELPGDAIVAIGKSLLNGIHAK